MGAFILMEPLVKLFRLLIAACRVNCTLICEREINGIGNTSDDWDVDECYMRLMIIPFEQNLQGFRRAYRLARMCARLPRYQPRLAFALR